MTLAFFSFVSLGDGDPGAHRAYNRWHLYDHRPENLALDGVRWGDRWTAGEAGPPVLYRHHASGRTSQVELRCSACGQPMHATDIDLLPGPGADSRDEDGLPDRDERRQPG